MGLFGKKSNKELNVHAVFYEGDLPGFIPGHGCIMSLSDDKLVIKMQKPEIEITLIRDRIQYVEVLNELDYMKKFKNTTVGRIKKDKLQKSFYLIKYLDKDHDDKSYTFWGTSIETLQVFKIQKALLNEKGPQKFEV